LTTFLWLFERVTGPGPDLGLRLVFTFALALLCHDALVVAQACKGPRSLRNPDRWRLATTTGWYLAGVLLLVTWSGPDPINFIGPIVGGIVFGGMTAFLRWGDAEPAPLPGDRFDTDRAFTDRPFAGPFYYAWHWIVLALVIWMLLEGPSDAWSTDYLLFQICFFPWILHRYPLRMDTRSGRGGLALICFGTGLMVVGMYTL
jgi:hypothetical protein